MSQLQDSYDYVIVGGGVAAASAVSGIRSEDEGGSIAVIGSEPTEPVYRPALSKDLWLKAGTTLEDMAAGAEARGEAPMLSPAETTSEWSALWRSCLTWVAR